jgi:hypothetical protein
VILTTLCQDRNATRHQGTVDLALLHLAPYMGSHGYVSMNYFPGLSTLEYVGLTLTHQTYYNSSLSLELVRAMLKQCRQS